MYLYLYDIKLTIDTIKLNYSFMTIEIYYSGFRNILYKLVIGHTFRFKQNILFVQNIGKGLSK